MLGADCEGRKAARGTGCAFPIKVRWMSTEAVCSQRASAGEPNTATQFTQTLEKDVRPLLRKQPGVQQEVAFMGSNGSDAVRLFSGSRRRRPSFTFAQGTRQC